MLPNTACSDSIEKALLFIPCAPVFSLISMFFSFSDFLFFRNRYADFSRYSGIYLYRAAVSAAAAYVFGCDAFFVDSHAELRLKFFRNFFGRNGTEKTPVFSCFGCYSYGFSVDLRCRFFGVCLFYGKPMRYLKSGHQKNRIRVKTP